MIYDTLHKKTASNTNPTLNQGWTNVLLKGRQFLLQMWHRRITLVTNQVIIHEWGPDCDYDKRHISVVICITDIQ